jgi:hypothetical protein
MMDKPLQSGIAHYKLIISAADSLHFNRYIPALLSPAVCATYTVLGELISCSEETHPTHLLFGLGMHSARCRIKGIRHLVTESIRK